MKLPKRNNLTVILLYILALGSALVFHNMALKPQAFPQEDRLPVQAASLMIAAPLSLSDEPDLMIPEPEEAATSDLADEFVAAITLQVGTSPALENEVVIPPPSAKVADQKKQSDKPKTIENKQSVTPPADIPQEVETPPVQKPAEETAKPEPVEPAPSPAPQEPTLSAYDTDLNPYVLDVIKTYTSGPYPYLLNNDYSNYNGVTQTLHFQGSVLARAHPSGNQASHCSGITFEVFFRAMQARNRKLGLSIDDFNGMTFNELHDFLLIWYVANGPKSTNNIAVAMEKYGVGRRITNLEDARPGDFLDFSRTNNTGHTVVFLNWVRNGNTIVGLRYWSSQGSTNGIAERTEYFTTGGGNLRTDNVYIGRVSPVHQYRSFR